jgi:GDP-4-dehydro-6-deoxy-D-mannose reductase
MKVLITGAAGFVGRSCIAAWQSCGWQLFGTSRHANTGDGCTWLQCDLLDASQIAAAIDKIKPDAVLHLAAHSSVGESWKQPILCLSENLQITVNVLEGVRLKHPSAHLVLSGSAEVYAPSMQNLKEEDATVAGNPYAFSKLQQEQLAEFYRQHFGLKIICTRSFNQIGAGQDTRFVLPSFALQIKQQVKAGADKFELQVGNISTERDFTHVLDMAAAYGLLLQDKEAKHSIYNLGSGIATKISDIIEILQKLADKPIHIVVDEDRVRPNDVPRIVADNTRFVNEFNYTPKLSLYKAVKDLYDAL